MDTDMNCKRQVAESRSMDSSSSTLCQLVTKPDTSRLPNEDGSNLGNPVEVHNYGDGRLGVRGPNLRLTLYLPMFDMLGYQMAYTYLREKRDLEFVLSWLSTLGGACSAMGDGSSDWALEAGKVSIRQFRVAMKLRDPLTLSRCRLYFALSLTQRGLLKEARAILEQEYKFIKQLPTDCDPRLLRMCFGCWSRLQYAFKLKTSAKKQLALTSTSSSN